MRCGAVSGECCTARYVTRAREGKESGQLVRSAGEPERESTVDYIHDIHIIRGVTLCTEPGTFFMWCGDAACDKTNTQTLEEKQKTHKHIHTHALRRRARALRIAFFCARCGCGTEQSGAICGTCPLRPPWPPPGFGERAVCHFAPCDMRRPCTFRM